LPALARERLELDPAAQTIVAMGGSQGARSINEAIAALVTRRSIGTERQVLHICGKRDYEYMRGEERTPAEGNHVRLLAYLDDPADAYGAADIVVARAGASTLAELAVTGTAAILIPYPHAAEDHQTRNAAYFVERGAAVILRDADLDPDNLWWTLRDCLEPVRLQTMRAAAAGLAPADAGGAIVARIERLIPARVVTDARENQAP
jgi:UDP-N-acetylglucosamine--N-acetylmuramyl-(pentapeptide) pyrophosphoryl-undecaprenol N-acetylglucosamine transferase